VYELKFYVLLFLASRLLNHDTHMNIKATTSTLLPTTASQSLTKLFSFNGANISLMNDDHDKEFGGLLQSIQVNAWILP
jgi:hypothetical protein